MGVNMSNTTEPNATPGAYIYTYKSTYSLLDPGGVGVEYARNLVGF